jgi:hypothetical protein
MEKLQKCVNFILTVPVFFATSCICQLEIFNGTIVLFLPPLCQYDIISLTKWMGAIKFSTKKNEGQISSRSEFGSKNLKGIR